MPTFRIPLTGFASAYVYVEAETADEALEKADYNPEEEDIEVYNWSLSDGEDIEEVS